MISRRVAMFATVLVVGVAVATRAGVPTVNAAVARPTVSSDSDEMALGAALAKQFDVDRGIEPSRQSRNIEAYLQRVADSLGQHTKRKLPWRIHYDSHPAIKSGFALPGGYIVIWGGALAYMSTEDEVAAIIAHEMEHTDDGQVNRRIDSLVTKAQRSLTSPEQWNWREFGATYGESDRRSCRSDRSGDRGGSTGRRSRALGRFGSLNNPSSVLRFSSRVFLPVVRKRHP